MVAFRLARGGGDPRARRSEVAGALPLRRARARTWRVRLLLKRRSALMFTFSLRGFFRFSSFAISRSSSE